LQHPEQHTAAEYDVHKWKPDEEVVLLVKREDEVPYCVQVFPVQHDAVNPRDQHWDSIQQQKADECCVHFTL
jgi:hypothetical protein